MPFDPSLVTFAQGRGKRPSTFCFLSWFTPQLTFLKKGFSIATPTPTPEERDAIVHCRGTSKHLILRRHPFILLGGDRHCQD